MDFIEFVKNTIGVAINFSGIGCLVRQFSRKQRFALLMYHRVSPVDDLDPKLVSASPENFEKQMRFLSKKFNVISFSDLLEAKKKNKTLPKNCVLISFDDGYADNYKYAYPILKKYNLPALISIPTAYPDSQDMFWWDQTSYLLNHTKKKFITLGGEKIRLGKKTNNKINRLYVNSNDKKAFLRNLSKELSVKIPNKRLFLTWKEIKEMSKENISFAPHTVNHVNINELNKADARGEILKSARDLKQKIEKTMPVFTYPYGDSVNMNNDIDSFLKKSGFEFSLSTIYGTNRLTKDTFRIKRIGIEKNDNMYTFKMKLLGMFSFLSRIYLKVR